MIRPKPSRRRVWFKISIGVAVVAAALTLLVGFAHSSWGRQTALGRFVMTQLAAACPVRSLSRERAESLRQQAMHELAGTHKALSRPAWRFRFGQTSFVDVRASLGKLAKNCVIQTRGFHQLDCTQFPFALDPNSHQPTTADEVVFTFSPQDRLVAITVQRHFGADDLALEYWQQSRESLARALGEIAPTSHPDLKRDYASDSLEYRYKDYYAKLMLVRLHHHLAEREIYESASEIVN